MTTVSYGTFGNANHAPDSLDVKTMIVESLGEHGKDYDIPAVAAYYRSAVNDVLTGTGISLAGNEFIGPDRVTTEQNDVMDDLIARAGIPANTPYGVLRAAIIITDRLFWAVVKARKST